MVLRKTKTLFLGILVRKTFQFLVEANLDKQNKN